MFVNLNSQVIHDNSHDFNRHLRTLREYKPESLYSKGLRLYYIM